MSVILTVALEQQARQREGVAAEGEAGVVFDFFFQRFDALVKSAEHHKVGLIPSNIDSFALKIDGCTT